MQLVLVLYQLEADDDDGNEVSLVAHHVHQTNLRVMVVRLHEKSLHAESQ